MFVTSKLSAGRTDFDVFLKKAGGSLVVPFQFGPIPTISSIRKPYKSSICTKYVRDK